MAEPAGSVSELSLPSAQPMNLGHLVGSPSARYANYIGQCYPFFVACLLLEIAVFLFSERKKRLQQQQAPSSASPHVADLSPRAALVKSNGEPTGNPPHDAAISAAVLHNVEQTDRAHASSRMNSDPPVYRTNNAVISMCTGMLQETAHIFFINYMLYVPYLYVWENYALYRMPVNAATWVFTLLGIDLAYYWLHRMAHEVNMLWAHHITHHNSEDYNLTTALRQGAFQYSFGCLFYTPLAFFVPPVVFSFHQQFNRLYQFWIHTVYIDKLPFPFETLLVSPSHHRVHHGRNKEYIDKNYGGCFIIWDKLFGTFEEERKTAVYGVTTNLTTWDPWTATFHHWGEMWRAAQRQDSLYMKVSVLWRSPGWVFYQLEHNARDLKLRPRVRFHTSSPLSLNCYACVQALLLMATLRVLALTQCVVRSWLYGGLVAHIFFSTYCFGALYDARPIGRVLEALRCAYMLVFSLFGALSSPSSFAAATLWSPSIPDSLSASYHRLSLGSARLLALLSVDRPPHAALWTVVSAVWAVSLLCVWRMAIAHTASSQAAAPGVGEGDSADNKKNA